MDNSKDNLQEMLDLAEFGAKRHNDRRSIEFRIFLSYTTPLILACYNVIKLDQDLLKSVDSWLICGGAIIYALGIHLPYILWQVGVGKAMENDAWRRNFYLAKAESILHHLSKNLNAPFRPSNDTVKVYCGYKKTQMTEKELFEKKAANLTLVRNFWELFKHLDCIWKDWSRLFVVIAPTMLLFFLIATLVLKKNNWLP